MAETVTHLEIPLSHERQETSYGVVIFDCDSTLCRTEGIDELARMNCVAQEVAELTDQAMAGQKRFEDVFVKRLELIRPTREQLESLGQHYIATLLPDAKAVVGALRFLNKDVYLISGGYDVPLSILGRHLGFEEPHILANRLRFKSDGSYLGFDPMSPLWRNGGKAEVIKRLRTKGKKTLLVGDSVTDLEAQPEVDLFVGFGGVVSRESVRRQSPVFIHQPTLAPVLLLATTPEELDRLPFLEYGPLLNRARLDMVSLRCVTFKTGYRKEVIDLAHQAGISPESAYERMWQISLNDRLNGQ